MAEQTQTEIERRGLLNVHARQMDAEHLDFPDASFDCVLCGFALGFFPRLEQALDEFSRVLKPGGRLATSTWGDEDPRWNWYGEMCKAYGIGVRMMTQNLDAPGEIQAALQRAGFAGIQISTETYDMTYESEEEWWMMRWSISGRATLEQMEPEVLARFKAEAFERMQAIKQSDGFHDELKAHFANATKPQSIGS